MQPEDRIREMELTIEELESRLDDQDRRLEAVENELSRLRDPRRIPPEQRGFFSRRDGFY
jgi:predicted RNase H-like nuclease (RuvC/YqgF family)